MQGNDLISMDRTHGYETRSSIPVLLKSSQLIEAAVYGVLLTVHRLSATLQRSSGGSVILTCMPGNVVPVYPAEVMAGHN